MDCVGTYNSLYTQSQQIGTGLFKNDLALSSDEMVSVLYRSHSFLNPIIK